MAKTPKKHHFLTESREEPLPLPFDKSFYLGRAEGNNIVVDDLRASRRHCELFFDGNDFILTDLQSSNGTFLNGEQVTSTRLQDGDVIEIGHHAYVYNSVDDPAELKQKKRDTAHMRTQEMTQLQTEWFKQSDFTGTLATIHLPDLCQLLNLSRRNGVLLVQSDLGKAMLYFDEGEVVQAQYATFQGDEAVLAILKETRGHFSFKSDQKALEPNVNARLSHLLLEAARQADEGQ